MGWIETDYDTFSGSSIDLTKWYGTFHTNSDPNYTESAGKAHLGASSYGSFMYSQQAWDVTDSIVAIKLSHSGTAASTTQFGFGLFDNTNSGMIYAHSLHWTGAAWTWTAWGGSPDTVSAPTGTGAGLGSDWVDGDWLGIGLCRLDEVLHLYKSSDGANWIEIGTCVAGGFDQSNVSVVLFTQDTPSTANWFALIDTVAVFAQNPVLPRWRISWDGAGKRYYEQGVDRGVLFATGFEGVPWNGLVAVTENPSGGTSESYFIDGVKYANLSTYEEFAGTIQAFTYPDEFYTCEGTPDINAGLYATAQPRRPFSFAYRTMIGDDLQNSYYKLHLVYNAMVAPSQRDNKSVAATADLMTFSWPFTTLPIDISSRRNTAHLIIDSRVIEKHALATIEDMLYGTTDSAPRMPSLFELNNAINAHVTVLVTDRGDGSYTVSGPDAYVYMPDADHFAVDWPSAVVIDTDTFSISSL